MEYNCYIFLPSISNKTSSISIEIPSISNNTSSISIEIPSISIENLGFRLKY